jgi:hypothetical protein
MATTSTIFHYTEVKGPTYYSYGTGLEANCKFVIERMKHERLNALTRVATSECEFCGSSSDIGSKIKREPLIDCTTCDGQYCAKDLQACEKCSTVIYPGCMEKHIWSCTTCHNCFCLTADSHKMKVEDFSGCNPNPCENCKSLDL